MKAVCGVSCLKGCRMSRPLGVSCTNFKHYSAQQTIDTASLKPFTPFCLIKKCMVTMKQGNTNYLKLLYNFKKGFLKVMSIIYLAWCFSRRHHQRKNNSSSQRCHLWSGQFSTLSSFNSMYFLFISWTKDKLPLQRSILWQT